MIRDYRVWNTDGEDSDDATVVRAFSAEDAATEWAARDDREGDHDIVSQRDHPIVCVQRVAGGSITHWLGSGEAVPTYYAQEVVSATWDRVWWLGPQTSRPAPCTRSIHS